MEKTKIFQVARTTAFCVFLALAAVPNCAHAQRGSLNLESLIQQSGMIFVGRVLDVHTGTKERRMNLFMTTYTFEVLDPIFGVEDDTLHIRQYGGEADGKEFYPPGVPRFEQGESVLVMLYPTSNIGMTSAVGKDQGKFWVYSDSAGARTVSNKLKNKGLFRRIRRKVLVTNQEWLQSEPEVLPYDQFIETVRGLTAELKKEKRKR